MLDQFLVVVSVTAFVMVTPGPDMLLVLRNTLLIGQRAGLQTSIGILSGNLVHIGYCLFGIGWLISRSILAFAALKYAAAAYLIYLGVTTIRSGREGILTPEAPAGRTSRTSFMEGFANNLLNPKGTLFYLGIFTTVITPETSLSVMLVLVSAMMIVSGCFWVCFVYTLDRRTVRSLLERSQRALHCAVGGLLILLGLRLAVTSR